MNITFLKSSEESNGWKGQKFMHLLLIFIFQTERHTDRWSQLYRAYFQHIGSINIKVCSTRGKINGPFLQLFWLKMRIMIYRRISEPSPNFQSDICINVKINTCFNITILIHYITRAKIVFCLIWTKVKKDNNDYMK